MAKILLIEDEMTTGTLYSFHLKGAGHEVAWASSGTSGLEKLKQFEPDLLLLDLMLPGINGIQILRKIRATRSEEEFPIIILTNTYNPRLTREAETLGATDFLVKSQTTVPRLLGAILGALAHGEATRPQSRQIASAGGNVGPPVNPEALAAFHEGTPQEMDKLSLLCRRLIESKPVLNSHETLAEIHRMLHTLTSKAALASANLYSDFCSAIETLVRDLCEKPQLVNASSIRTVNRAVNLLGLLFIQNPKDAAAVNIRDFQILVVDDEPTALKANTMSLQSVGLSCIQAQDGKAALQIIQSRELDLVILDVNMPEMDGIEVCRRLRLAPRHAKTPVLFVTAMATFETRLRSTQSGSNDLIGKPIRGIDLAVRCLTHILNRRLNTRASAFKPLSG